MKKLLKMIGLQFFADGGGGDGGAASAGGGSSAGTEGAAEAATEAQIPSNIPERARKHYKAAVEDIAKRNAGKPASADASTAKSQAPTEEEKMPRETKRTYRQLVESEEYKDAHRRAIQRAVDDRMKTHLASEKESNELLALVAKNYGLDPASETFRADLKKAMMTDENAIRRYADANDMSFDEAKRAMELESRLAKANAEAERARTELEQRKVAEENQRIWNELEQKANETRKQYPDFDLKTAMQDPRFRAVLNAWQGDTTAAYESINRHKLFEEKRIAAEKTAEERVANSVRANANRPREGAISSNQVPTAPDFSKMSKSELDAWAAEQRRLMRRA